MVLTPFRGFLDMHSEFDRVFKRHDRRAVRWEARPEHHQRDVGTKARGLRSKDSDLVLHYDLPGVGLEEVDITLDGSVLTISDERKPVTEEGGISLYYLEELCPTDPSAGA